MNTASRKATFEGRGAIITGASRGLGKALALELTRAGARVAMVARGQDELAQATAEIERVTGRRPAGIVADIADKRSIHTILGIAGESCGDIDLLVNNASSLGPVPMPILADLACEDLEAVLATNLVGPFRLTKAVANSMTLRRRGTIVFVSTDAAVNAYPTWGAYGASKAAADHVARTLAAELGDQNVRVFSVDPTEMDTAMHHAALPEADRATLAQPEAIARLIVNMVESADRANNGSRQIASEWRSQ